MISAKPLTVYMDVSIDRIVAGKMIFQLFYETTPRTCENFRRICTGENGTFTENEKTDALSYLNCIFYKIVPGKYVESGDVSHKNGLGGHSIYGKYFNDENFQIHHDKEGLLSMSSHGINKNSSKFRITLGKTTEFDGKQVVFGQLIYGLDVLKKIANVEILNTGFPKQQIKITDVGQMDDKRLFLTKDPLGLEGMKKIRDANARNRLFFEVDAVEEDRKVLYPESRPVLIIKPEEHKQITHVSSIKEVLHDLKEEINENDHQTIEKEEIKNKEDLKSKINPAHQILADLKAKINLKLKQNNVLIEKEVLEQEMPSLKKREVLENKDEMKRKIYTNLEKKNIQKYPFLNDPANLRLQKKEDLFDILKNEKPKEKFGWDGFLISF